MIKDSLHSIVNRIRGLTLDVCAGTFFSAEMARKIILPEYSQLLSLLIVCAVYAIYVIDHLADYRNSSKRNESYKFGWIRRTQRKIAISALIVVLTGGFILFKIYSPLLLLFGLLVGFLVFVYYLLGVFHKQNRIKRYPKEWIIAIVFTTGIWGFYLLSMPQWHFCNLIFALGFFMSMLLNTYLFSYFEKEEDNNENHFNIVNYLDEGRTTLHFSGIITAGMLMNIAALIIDTSAGFILLAMFSYLTGIYMNRTKLKNRTYGLIIDAVLFFPALYYLV